MERIRFKVRGLTPLLLHNLRLADPLEPVVKEIKKITSKGSKKMTEDDHARLSDLEWLGGLYVNEKQQPIFPADNIQGAFIEAAPKVQRGLRETLKAAISVEADALIVHDGPKTLDGLKADPRFRLRKPMKQMKNVIVRTRPRFPTWSLEFVVLVDTDMVNAETVGDVMTAISEYRGFGDHRPRYGKFEIVESKSLGKT